MGKSNSHSKVVPTVHLCGGTAFSCGAARKMEGLSPRRRGNLYRLGAHVDIGGSIPAWAGEPRSSESSKSGASVYPRVGGGTTLEKRRHVS